MPAGALEVHRRNFRNLGDPDTELFGTARHVIPGERPRELRLKLVAQRHRVVVIEEDEVIAQGQVEPGLENQTMLDRAGNRAHVHDLVGANQCGNVRCSLHSFNFFLVKGLARNAEARSAGIGHH